MEQRQAAPQPVSRRMLLVIAVALAVILLPATIAGLPVSKIRLIVTNANQFEDMYVNLHANGVLNGDESFSLASGEDRVFTLNVKPGTYNFYASYYYYTNTSYYGNNAYRTCTVSYFETEEVFMSLY